MQPLDHPQWAALATEHAGFARRRGRALAYPADVTPMSGLEDAGDIEAWAELAGLLDAGERTILMFTTPPQVPEQMRILLQRFILQMTGPETPPDPPAAPDGLVRLGLDDGPDMVALAALTEPGPMGLRTVTMGNWWGVRRQGRLVAMAGQRMHLTGLVEVSGVCTRPDVRGEGLARKLILQVLHDIAARGEKSFLHLKTENAAALGLYGSLGFKVRTQIHMSVVEAAPGG
jgi:ribosomal protein S18 acetylase RimI-like enzyme